MKNKLKFMFGFLVLFMSMLLIVSCEEDSEGESIGQSSSCAGGYKGPTGDIQSDSFCKVAYEYRCKGKDAQADANCKVYKQLREDNPGIPPCPYCP